MTVPSITLRTADPDDIERIEDLLEANDLPYRDVRRKPECFFVARSDGEFVGVGGVEVYGSNGLLRSVVIREQFRGEGLGTVLCHELEANARSLGVDALYLLTTTAVVFFRRLGYRELDRAEVPSRVRRTAEFEDLCPDSAVCLEKRLQASGT